MTALCLDSKLQTNIFASVQLPPGEGQYRTEKGAAVQDNTDTLVHWLLQIDYFFNHDLLLNLSLVLKYNPHSQKYLLFLAFIDFLS